LFSLFLKHNNWQTLEKIIPNVVYRRQKLTEM